MTSTMQLNRKVSSYGRLVPKPEKDEDQEVHLEENVSLQDQIENLRTKISLKERYNKVLDEELEECRLGASTITADLWAETYRLRNQLVEALDAEKKAVHNALRSHRDFQLALTGKAPAFALAWLDDKVFDMSKRLNRILDDLSCKRLKLKESEDIVKILERYPRPGTSKWESDAQKRCRKLEYAIENMKVKKETASILHAKYQQIKDLLLGEKGYYAPTLRNLNNQLMMQKRELDQLNKMLNEAIVFQKDAMRNLAITEKEASENRRRRRRQMTRMKKAVQKVLEDNMAISHTAELRRATTRDPREPIKSSSIASEHADDAFADTTVTLRIRKAEVEKFQEKARRLVEAMRVPDLTYIPGRLKAVYDLAEHLKHDREKKEKNRDFLICQRDHLTLIHNYFTYTSQKSEAEFETAQATITEHTDKIEEEILEKTKDIQKYGEITIEVRLGLISILQLLDDGSGSGGGILNAHSPSSSRKSTGGKLKQPSDTKELLRLVFSRVTSLVNQVESLKKSFPEALDDLDERNPLKNYVRSQPVPPKLIRVGTPENGEESDDDDFEDLAVPTRHDIKAKNAKLISTAMLKRGIV